MLLPVRGAGGRGACAIRYYTSWLNRRKHIWTPKAAKEHCPGPAVGDGLFSDPPPPRLPENGPSPVRPLRRTAVLQRGRARKRPFSGGGGGSENSRPPPRGRRAAGRGAGDVRGAGGRSRRVRRGVGWPAFRMREIPVLLVRPVRGGPPPFPPSPPASAPRPSPRLRPTHSGATRGADPHPSGGRAGEPPFSKKRSWRAGGSPPPSPRSWRAGGPVGWLVGWLAGWCPR